MSVLVRYAGVRERDFFDRAFETLDAYAIVDLEEVPEDERKAAEEIRSELFGSESEDQASDSGAGKQRADVYSYERKQENRSESPDERRSCVFQEREKFFRERAGFEDFRKRFVEHRHRHNVCQPEAREAGDYGQRLVRYGEVFVDERSDSNEEFPTDRTYECVKCGNGCEAGRRSEYSHMEAEKLPVDNTLREKNRKIVCISFLVGYICARFRGTTPASYHGLVAQLVRAGAS